MPSSSALRNAVNKDPITTVYTILLEFREDGQSTVHRAALNNEDVLFEGNTFTKTRMDFSLPDSSDAEGSVRLSMSNITRTVGSAIARAKNLIGCRIILVELDSGAEPVPTIGSAIKDTKDLFVLRNAQGDSEQIIVELGLRASLSEPVPFRRTSKSFFPGVWFAR